MTTSSLRLVVGSPESTGVPALDLPVSDGTALHVHLHLAGAATATATTTALPTPPARRWLGRLLYAAATVVLVVVSYDVGTFAHRPSYEPAAPTGFPGVGRAYVPPSEIERELAQPPVVTPPPPAPAPGSAFGLRP